MALMAGAARKDITNRSALFLAGYPHVPRLSEGVHDPLWATALYLGGEDGGILCIAVDILFVDRPTAVACRQAIGEATGLTPERILISATHTHSGPLTATVVSWLDDRVVPAPDPVYMEAFRKGIIAAGVEAFRRAEPAELAITSVLSEGVGGNRLRPDGPRDPEVGVIAVRSAAGGRPLAVQVVYSMHPTVLHEDSRLVSSDFPHYTRGVLQAAWPGAAVLYHTGPCGNLSPRYHVRGQTFAEAERLGSALGRQIAAGLAALGPGDFRREVPLAAAAARVTLPPRTFGTVAEAERELREAVAEYDRLRREGAPHGPLRTAECTVFGAEERLTLTRAQAAGTLAARLREINPAEVQALRVGDVWLVGWPGECFVEYALALKARRRAFVISLANGELQGYIPTPDATGYEARLSVFEPAAGGLLVQAALELTRLP